MKSLTILLFLLLTIQAQSAEFVVQVSAEHAPIVQRLLKIIVQTELSKENLTNRYNQNILGNRFDQYFYQRINKIKEIKMTDKQCLAGALAFVEEGSPEKHTMFVCPGFFNDQVVDLMKVSIMLHEARHIDGFHHTMCMTGANIGALGGCDERIEDRGSYAVTAEFLAKLLFRSTGLSAEMRRELKLSLLETLESFNERPSKIGNQAIYLIAEKSGLAYYYDGTSLTPAPRFGDSRVAVRQDGLVIIPKNNADIYMLDPMKVTPVAVAITSQCAQQFNQTPQAQRVEVIEVANDLSFSICVQKNRIWGSISQFEVADSLIDFPFEIDRIYTSAELGKAKEDSVYIVGKNKRFYRADYQNEVGFSSVELSAKEYEQSWAAQFTKLFYFNSELMGLTYDGRLLKIDAENVEAEGVRWIPAPGAEKLRASSVTRPFLWSKDLLD